MELHLEKLKESKAASFLFEERVNRALFFAGFTLYLLWKFHCITVMSLPEGSRIYTVVHLLVWVLLVMPAVSSFLKGDSRLRISILIALFVGVALKVTADNIALIDLTFLFAAGASVEFRSITKRFLFVVGICLALTIAMSQLGIIVDYPFPRGGDFRHGLGFSYCTYPSLLFMYLVLAYLYLRGASVRWRAYAVILAIDVIMYLATDSRSPFGLVILACVVSVLCTHLPKDLPVLRGVAYAVRFLPLVIMAISLAASLAYDPSSSLWAKLNSVSSNRLAQTQASLEKYGVKPFGQYINFKGNALYAGSSGEEKLVIEEGADRNFIDSSYMQTLVCKGFVTTVLLLGLLFVCCRKVYGLGDYLGCWILGLVFLSTAFDPQLLDLLYDVFLFYIWKHAVERCADDD